MTVPTHDKPEWPLRPWVLSALLGLAGFVIWLATGENGPGVTDRVAAAVG